MLMGWVVKYFVIISIWNHGIIKRNIFSIYFINSGGGCLKELHGGIFSIYFFCNILELEITTLNNSMGITLVKGAPSSQTWVRGNTKGRNVGSRNEGGLREWNKRMRNRGMGHLLKFSFNSDGY
jgi:hypothetical protein